MLFVALTVSGQAGLRTEQLYVLQGLYRLVSDALCMQRESAKHAAVSTSSKDRQGNFTRHTKVEQGHSHDGLTFMAFSVPLLSAKLAMA